MKTHATPMRTLVIGLGNDLLADDAVGIAAARLLTTRLAGRADVVATSAAGIALLDTMIGYDRVIVIDAVVTGRHPLGSILEIETDALRPTASPSPHYVGLPELVELARQLELPFPSRARIFAVEVGDLHTIGGRMSEAVQQALPELCDEVCRAVAEDKPRPDPPRPDPSSRCESATTEPASCAR